MLDKDNKLEGLLRERAYEAPSKNLEERIIMAATHVEQMMPRKSFWEWLEIDWLLPRPAYAYACISVLMAGFWMGTEMQPASDTDTQLVSQEALFFESWDEDGVL